MSDKMKFKLFEIRSEIAASGLRLKDIAEDPDMAEEDFIQLKLMEIDNHLGAAIAGISDIALKLGEGYEDFT